MKYCLASSRENTMMRAGRPISPVSRRFTRVLPSEPVPPVIRILFPSRGSTSISPFVGGGVLRELRNQISPGRRLIADRSAELVALHAAIANLRVVGDDFDVELVSFAEGCQQVVFRDGRRCHLVQAGQAAVAIDDVF